jgi:hypothetical protein
MSQRPSLRWLALRARKRPGRHRAFARPEQSGGPGRRKNLERRQRRGREEAGLSDARIFEAALPAGEILLLDRLTAGPAGSSAHETSRDGPAISQGVSTWLIVPNSQGSNDHGMFDAGANAQSYRPGSGRPEPESPRYRGSNADGYVSRCQGAVRPICISKSPFRSAGRPVCARSAKFEHPTRTTAPPQRLSGRSRRVTMK